MNLTEWELKEIRHSRISNYRKRIDKFSTIDELSHNILVDDLYKIIAGINEIENELDEKYPKWNECPF